MRIFALTTSLIVGGLMSMAVPAKPTPVKYVQPDGTEIMIQKRGDESHHICLSEDGYLLVEKDGAMYYGDVDPLGSTINSGILAKPMAQRDAKTRQYLGAIDKAGLIERVQRQLEIRQSRGMQRKCGVGLFSDATYPVWGNSKGLVILVEYTDKKFTLDDPYDYFSRMLHEEGFSDYGGTGSAHQFYVESSAGLFQPEFDIYGPITLNHNMSYYGGNDWWGNDENPEKMAIEACQILDSEVDFSQYDCDGDGYIDNVYLFYAGQGEASYGGANTVWPHSWNITAATSTPYYFDGVRLDRYACSNEWESGRPDGVGTFCHEFSHVMGLPDLYATSYTNAFTPGAWSVMDYGPYNNDGRTPPLFGAFERNALGWLDPTVIDRAMSCQLPNIKENVGFVIPTSKDTEFFLLENRQQEGWDEYIPGHGMLIWHIDYVASVWNSNTVNNSSSHQYVDIEEADGTQSESNRAGDSFPGTSNKRTFTDTTNPSMKTWGGQGLNLPITNIQEVNGLITFDVCGGGELVVASNAVTPMVNQIYLPGELCGWNPEESPVLTTSDYINFYGFAHLGGEFKLTSAVNWDGLVFGQGEEEGILSDDAEAGNLNMEEEALYWCRFNIKTHQWDAIKIETVGAIGSFNGWEEQVNFAPSEDFTVWSGTVHMEPGDEWKIRCNDDWDINLGGKLSALTLNGGNMSVGKRGNYTYTIDLGHVPYSGTAEFERTYLFTELAPTILDSTEATDSSFVANWEPMAGAVEYQVTVLTPDALVGQYDIVNFDNGTKNLPQGWVSSSTLSYSNDGRYGETAPSLRFANIGGYIQSPMYEEDIRSFSFWTIGANAAEGNTMEVSLGDSIIVFDIDNANSRIITFDSIPAGVRQVKIEYIATTHAGSIAVDDITVLWGNKENLDSVGVYMTDEGCSLAIEGLEPLTEYICYVEALNEAGDVSLPSQTVRITTLEKQPEDGILDAVMQAAVWVEGNLIKSEGEGEVYTIDGRLVGRTPATVPAGIYIVTPHGGKPIKVVVSF